MVIGSFFESQRIVADLESAAAVGAGAAVAVNIWFKPATVFAGLGSAYYALLVSRITHHNVGGRGTIIDLTWALFLALGVNETVLQKSFLDKKNISINLL